jgi:hypothetical protein
MVENFEVLAYGVVKQAAADYRDALCNYHNTGEEEYEWEINKLRKFFTSDETMIKYTKIDGEALMRGIEQQVIAFNYDLKAIKDSLKEDQELADEEES